MIDQHLDAEFEQLIRVTLEEMIPKAHEAAQQRSPADAGSETSRAGEGPATPTVELLASPSGRPRRPRVLACAAAVMLLVAVGVIAVLLVARDAPATPAQQPPVDVPNALPVPPLRPDVYPIVSDRFDRADEATAMYGSQFGWETEAAEALVARRVDGTIADGIRLSVVAAAGSMFASGPAEDLTVAGIDVKVYVDGGTPVQRNAVVPGTPALAAWGLDPMAFLEAAGGFPITGARVVDDGSVTFDVSALPVGYEVVVPPTRLPAGSINALTRVPDGDGGDGISVWVDVRNALVNDATAGDLQAVDINGTIGWARDVGRGSSVSWPVSATTWATVGGASSLDAALALARAVSFADEATWRARYGVVEPEFSSKEDQLASPVSTLPEPEPASTRATTSSG